MAIQHRIGVDWDQDGFVVWEGVPGDAPNLVTDPVDLSALTRSVTGTSASQSIQVIDEVFGNAAIDWVSGTSSNGYVQIGSLADPIAPASAKTQYIFSFWIKSESASYDAVPLRVEYRRAAGSDGSLGFSNDFVVLFASGWVQKTFVFTTDSTASYAGVYFRIQKNTSTTNASYDISGLTLIPSTSLNLARFPLDLGSYTTSLTGTATAVSIEVLSPVETFGDVALDFVSGTDVNSTLRVGAVGNGIAYTAISTAYTAVFWIRSESAAYDAINVVFRIRRATGSEADLTVTTGAPVPFASGWVKKVINFTTDGTTTEVMLLVSKSGSSTNASWDVSGIMILPGTLADADFDRPDDPAFNAGALSLYDNISGYAMEARWNIGAREAYVAVADMAQLEVVLNNVSKIFSPEYISSPLNGVMAERSIAVESSTNGGTTWTRQFTGFIDNVLPTPGANGPYTAILTASDNRRFLEGKQVRVALLTSVYFTDVINAVIDTSDIPGGFDFEPPLAGQGRYQWPYVGDNWEEGVDALQALVEAAASERGFIYFNRANTLRYLLRVERYANVPSIDGTFDNAQEAMDYRYGDVIYNDIEVVRYPRKASTSSTLQLWELNEDFTLTAGETYTIFARYTDGDADKTIGAETATVAEGTFTASGAGVTRTLTPKSNGCEILYNNTSGSSRTITAHTLTGRRITAKDAVTINVSDATSIATHGRRPLRLDLKNVAVKADALEIATIELDRHKLVSGRVASITIGQRDSTNETRIVFWTVGNTCTVNEDQTGHNRSYYILGTSHEVTDAMTVTKCTFYLEPQVDLI